MNKVPVGPTDFAICVSAAETLRIKGIGLTGNFENLIECAAFISE